MQSTARDTWTGIEPLLNDALASLGTYDREAVLLRYFEGRSMGETGQALRVSEDAARMRVSRAIDKLRRYFSKHGLVVTAAVLTGLLTDRAVHAAPISVSAVVMSAIGGSAGSSIVSISEGVLNAMWKFKMIRIFAPLIVAVVVGGTMMFTVNARNSSSAAPAQSGQGGQTMEGPTGIYDITILTSNVTELGAFYDKLGLRRAISRDDFIVYSMPNQDFVIHTAPSKQQSPIGLTFFVNDIASTQENLKRLSVPFDGPKPLQAGLKGLELTDPNGNKVNLALPRGR